MANAIATPTDAALTRKVSMWSALPTFRQSLPGLLALIIIAIFCGVPGIPWPYTIEALLKYIDAVLPPIYGKALFIDLLHFNYVVIGLAVGIVIRNMVGVPKNWEPGLSYTAVFMNVGIIILGSQYMAPRAISRVVAPRYPFWDTSATVASRIFSLVGVVGMGCK